MSSLQKRNGCYFKSARGFTLIEILCAVFIISVALLAVHRNYTQTIVMANYIKFYAKAPLLAQSKMSEIDLISDPDLADDSGDYGEDFPGYTWEIAIADVESDAEEQIAANLKQVDVSIFYHTDEFEFSLRQYKYVPES